MSTAYVKISKGQRFNGGFATQRTPCWTVTLVNNRGQEKKICTGMNEWATSRGTEIQTPAPDYETFAPTTNVVQAWPIINRERISRTIDHSGLWIAYYTEGYVEGDEGKTHMQCDKEELTAGLRCYVSLKMGEFVDVPKELTEI